MSRKGFQLENLELKKQLKNLYKPLLKETLKAFTIDWGIITVLILSSKAVFIAYGYSACSFCFYFFTCFLISSRQRALENLIHEATHYNLCENKILNDVLGWTCAALPLGHNINKERLSHIQGHHQLFWENELDPDFKRYKNAGFDKLPVESFFELFNILFRGFIRYIYDTILYFILPQNEKILHFFVRIVVFWAFIMFSAFKLDFINGFLMYWFIPYFTFLVTIRYIAEITEHAALGCAVEFNSTRNNIGIINETFIHPHGDGFHLVHHLYPKIPFYNLKKAHELLKLDEKYLIIGKHCNSFFWYKDSSIQSLIKRKSKNAILQK